MHSLKRAGHWLDQGTAYWVPGYHWAFKLCKDLNVPMYSQTLWHGVVYDNMQLGRNETKYATNFDHLMGESDHYMNLFEKYSNLRSSFFKTSNENYMFPDKMEDSDMKILGSQTFEQFLIDNGLEDLKPFADYLLTFFLYAPTNGIDVYNALYWLNEGSLLDVINGGTLTNRFKTAISFNGLVEKMVIEKNIDVIYNCKVSKVMRTKNKGVQITYQSVAMPKKVKRDFDFLVSAIHPSYYESKSKNSKKQGKQVFKMSPTEDNLRGDAK